MLECAKSLPDGMQLAGAVCVAPATYKEWEIPFPNVPVGIIIPQMDGDVISLDGSDIYEDLIADTQYTSTAELIYLKNANHAYFNTQLTQPDLNHEEANLAKLMPAQQQRDFLAGYLTDFVKSAVTTGQSVFASASPLESSAYGCDVLLRVHSGTAKMLYTAESDDLLTCAGSAAATREIASYLPDQNTVGTFKLPGGSSLGRYDLQRIVWSGTDSHVTIPAAGDITGCRFLDIDMALDSTDSQNSGGQPLTLLLTDADGKTAQSAIDPSAAALLWQEGELAEKTGWDGNPTQEYSTFTPLVTMRLDLSKLDSIDLSRLANLQMSFGSSGGDSMMLRSISAAA